MTLKLCMVLKVVELRVRTKL